MAARRATSVTLLLLAVALLACAAWSPAAASQRGLLSYKAPPGTLNVCATYRAICNVFL